MAQNFPKRRIQARTGLAFRATLACSLGPHAIVPRGQTHSQSAMKRVHPTDKHVGSRLRMRRIMLHKSQSEVADALGLTFQQLQKYENGSNRVSASRLQHLCAILQVPVSFFFEGAPQEPKLPMLGSDEQSPSYVNDFLATSDGVALAWRSVVSASRRCGGRSLHSSSKSSSNQSMLMAGWKRQRLQPPSRKSAGTLPTSPIERILKRRVTTLELSNCQGQLLSRCGRFDYWRAALTAVPKHLCWRRASA